MLILTRKSQEAVVIGAAADMNELLRVTVIEIRGSTVKLGFVADAGMAVHRHEVWERVRAECLMPKPKDDSQRSKRRA